MDCYSQVMEDRRMKHRATVVCIRDERILLVAKRRDDGHYQEAAANAGNRFRLLPYGNCRRRRNCPHCASITFQFWAPRTRHFTFVARLPTGAQQKPDNEIARCRWASSKALRACRPASPPRESRAMYRGCLPCSDMHVFAAVRTRRVSVPNRSRHTMSPTMSMIQ